MQVAPQVLEEEFGMLLRFARGATGKMGNSVNWWWLRKKFVFKEKTKYKLSNLHEGHTIQSWLPPRSFSFTKGSGYIFYAQAGHFRFCFQCWGFEAAVCGFSVSGIEVVTFALVSNSSQSEMQSGS